MTSSKTSTGSGGMPLLGLLGVAFVILKLCHVITWPWVWVLAPFWGGLVLAGFVLAITGVTALIMVLVKR